jgi:hypothetical protein
MMDKSLHYLLTTRKQMEDATKELQRLHDELSATGSQQALTRHDEAMRQLQLIRDEFLVQYEKTLAEDCLDLGDGSRLIRSQYWALLQFAENNGLSIARVLAGVSIRGAAISECNFEEFQLRTLEGLQDISSLTSLRLAYNRDLTSLLGVPTAALRELDARNCGICGDLSPLQGASKLTTLWIYGNPGLTSLHGVPTQSLREIHAGGCGLIGDLSALDCATNIDILHVSFNKHLTSLQGLPITSLKQLDATGCGLTGDHSFLESAPHLGYLALAGNPNSLLIDRSKLKPTCQVTL